MLGGATFRTADAYGTLALVGLDYKLHYGRASWLGRKQYDGRNLAEKVVYEQRLHRRNAERIVAMLKRVQRWPVYQNGPGFGDARQCLPPRVPAYVWRDV